MIGYVYLPFLTGLYLGIVSILKTFKISICEGGCEATNTIIKIEPLYLYYIGTVSMIVLFLIGLYIKKNIKEEPFVGLKMFSFILNIIFISESILFSTLVFNQEFCIFCMIFYALLITMMIVNKEKLVLSAIPIWISIYLLTKNGEVEDFKYTLIGKENCQYCEKVKNGVLNNVEYSYKNYQDFKLIKELGIKKVPILIKKENQNIFIIEGVENIEKEFIKKDHLVYKQDPMVDFLEKKDIFSEKNNAGCVIEKPCEEKK